MPIVLNCNIQRDASVCRQNKERGDRKQVGRKGGGEKQTPDLELGAGRKAPKRRWAMASKGHVTLSPRDVWEVVATSANPTDALSELPENFR